MKSKQTLTRGRGKGTHRAVRIVLRDVVLFCVALNVFALFHHVLPRKLQPVGVSSSISSTPAPTAEITPDISPGPTASAAGSALIK